MSEELNKKDYKSTLNLPHTDFPMKGNLPVQEPKWVSQWTDRNLYGQIRQGRKGKPQFILHDGPPYANGDIHVGHALSRILKDMVIKSKTLSGFDCPYVPGWDCHGLPIEHQVEKKTNKSDPIKFKKACREYAISQFKNQRKDFQRLGVLADWENPYLTADAAYEAETIRALAQITENGFLERREKPVYWCLDCRSSLAEAEVEYKNKKSPSIDVGFFVLKKNVALWSEKFNVPLKSWPPKTALLIWTTTPWTLPANEAVALSPEVVYVLVQRSNNPVEAIICAESLLSVVLERIGFSPEQTRILGQATGAQLEHLWVQHPLLDKQVPVVLGDHVTLDAGTGAVHTAPAHGEEDYQVGLRYQLPIQHHVGPDGVFTAGSPIAPGLSISQAVVHILDQLEESGLLFSNMQIEHSYLHCWRHKTPVIFRATPQWFIPMEQLRQRGLDAIGQVQWIPQSGENRIRAMTENRPDWCVSRQRLWCVPIPIFLHRDTGQWHPRTVELMRQVADRVEKEGIEAWTDPVWHSELLGEDADSYHAISDGLDVWFDSGVSHWAVLRQRPELRYPADLYLEGSDQHRGWFQSSLMTAMALNLPAPYHQVLTHGFVVDGQGHKMSKSLGNVIAPQKVVQNLGADVLRLWVAATDYHFDISVSDEILKRMVDSYRRIRNTVRFLLANLNGFDPQKDLLDPEACLELDRGILQEAFALQDEILRHYELYEFHAVYQKIHQFCSLSLGSFYLDIIKDRQYTTAPRSRARLSAQTALYHLSELLVRWMAPILSFTAEEIWTHLPGVRPCDSVFLSHWQEPLKNLQSDMHLDWAWIRTVRDAVNQALESLRKGGQIGSSLDAEVILYADAPALVALSKLKDELRFVLITSYAQVRPAEERTTGAVQSEIPGIWLEVNVSTHEKCERCWHHREEVGSHPIHPTICQRCVDNITTATGECREYA